MQLNYCLWCATTFTHRGQYKAAEGCLRDCYRIHSKMYQIYGVDCFSPFFVLGFPLAGYQ